MLTYGLIMSVFFATSYNLKYPLSKFSFATFKSLYNVDLNTTICWLTAAMTIFVQAIPLHDVTIVCIQSDCPFYFVPFHILILVRGCRYL